MTLLFAFAPFWAFIGVELVLGTQAGLCAGAAAALLLMLADYVRGKRQIKLLEAGAALLFSVLAACAICISQVRWSIGLVRLWVDTGLMLIILAGVALGHPFTLQYTLSKVTPGRGASADFLQANNRLACAWALAFAVMALADLWLMLRPGSASWTPATMSISAVALALHYSLRRSL